MSVEQKYCFVAFKAIVKLPIHEMKIKYKEDIQVSTYHLKTIFLWACETISSEQWNSVRGWAKCFLYLLDQLIICLEHTSLPSYFIPQCNLLDGIKLFKSFQIMIQGIRLKPLQYAAEFVDSMVMFHPKEHINHNMSASLRILDNGRSIHRHSFILCDKMETFNETSIFERESRFLKNIFQSLKEVTWVTRFISQIENVLSRTSILRRNDMFKRANCGLLSSFANWCKENKDRRIHLFEEMTLFDVIRLENIHGLSVSYDILGNFFERESRNNACSIETDSYSEFKESLSDQSLYRFSLFSKILLILHSLNAGKIETARDELECLINIICNGKHDIYFDIICIVDETGYQWLFTSRVTNLIREYKNVFGNKEASVSVKVFSRFLLSMCHKKLSDEHGLKFQLGELNKILKNGEDSAHYLGNVLLGEVAEMAGDDRIGSNICKSTLIFTFEAIDDLMCAETTASENAHSVSVEIRNNQNIGSRDDFEKTYPVRNRKWFITGCHLLKFALVNLHVEKMKIMDLLLLRFSIRKTLILPAKLLFSYDPYTIADAVYIAQDMIHAHEYHKALTILEQVVSKEFSNPLSVIIWPRELMELVDDAIKSEIRESRNGCIVLPSVVYALYLLARVYHSIGNREAFEETQVRLEYICDFMGDDLLISKRLLELVNNF